MRRLQISVGAVALALALVSCNKSPSDDSLANDVKAKLYADIAVKQANIDVAVKNGSVMLTGNAPSADAALAAVNDANSITGVKHVDNQIQVASAGNQLPNAGNAVMPPPPAAVPMPQAAPSESERRREERREHRDESGAPMAGSTPAAPVPLASTTIPAGTSIAVRTIDTINSGTAQAGQTFHASLAQPVESNGAVVLQQGLPVTLSLVTARGAGRIDGRAELQLQMASIDVHGQTYQVSSSDVTQMGNARGKQTAVRTGIGAAAGAIIGAIAGGGKGAAIGSAAGAGTGIGYQVFTHGKQVAIPSESVLNFTLQAPLTVH